MVKHMDRHNSILILASVLVVVAAGLAVYFFT
jgi:hypothetical protein